MDFFTQVSNLILQSTFEKYLQSNYDDSQHRVMGLGYPQQQKFPDVRTPDVLAIFRKLNHLCYHALSISKPRVLFIFKITHIGGIE